MIEWITVDKMAEQTGLTREAIRALKKKGCLRQGIHWVKRGGRIWLHVESMNKWIRDSAA